MASAQISVVDFISGCGGTSQGLRDAGMQIVAGIDNDHDAAESYKQNFRDAVFFERDVIGIDPSEIVQILPKSGQILFAACAPCQPFSSQQKLGYDNPDPRRFLLLQFLRFVDAVKPDFILYRECARNAKNCARPRSVSYFRFRNRTIWVSN